MTHHVDLHVGQRIRHRRWMIKMTQKKLGDIVGIKFQQIQKYETGANRVSASRLFEISKALDVHVSYFFDDLNLATDTSNAADAPEGGYSDKDHIPSDLFHGREAIELLRCFYSWPAEQRQHLLDLTRSISEAA